MIRRISLLVAVIALLAAPAAATARRNVAVLIDVHITRAAAAPSTGANCSNSGAANGLYALIGWEVQSDKTAHLNTATIPAGLNNVQAILQASFDVWEAAEPAAPTITVDTDGTVTKQTANHRYDLLWGRASGNSIAVTYTWQWSNGEIESDTIFNKRVPWFTAASEGDGCKETIAAYDLRNIATHEFGHTHGIGHPGNDRFETMYAYGYTGETLKWSLANGDIAGIRANY